jgi:prepilin-type N-terminal cleavage/methylation domain-containing protein
VCHDNRGMTLIEILISLTLVSIVSVALIQSALVAMNVNVVNELRDEAVSVAEQRMNELRNTPFPIPNETNALTVTFPGSVTEAPVTRNFRAFACQYTIIRTVSQIDPNNRQVTLKVTWSYKRVQYEHSVSTVLSQRQL